MILVISPASMIIIIVISSAYTIPALSPLGRLPVGAIVFLLTEKLEVAAAAQEATRCSAQRGRHLALQRGLRVIVRAALGLWNYERCRGVLLVGKCLGGRVQPNHHNPA